MPQIQRFYVAFIESAKNLNTPSRPINGKLFGYLLHHYISIRRVGVNYKIKKIVFLFAYISIGTEFSNKNFFVSFFDDYDYYINLIAPPQKPKQLDHRSHTHTRTRKHTSVEQFSFYMRRCRKPSLLSNARTDKWFSAESFHSHSHRPQKKTKTYRYVCLRNHVYDIFLEIK